VKKSRVDGAIAQLATAGARAYHLPMIDFGMASADFKTHYFEQQPHLFRRALNERPIDWTDVDALLRIVPPRAPAMRMFLGGVVAENEYTNEVQRPGSRALRLNKRKFYTYLSRGATLVINRLEDYDLAAKRLCAEIARFAGAQATGNAYMSFTGDGTFGRHWDTHDVFAVQLRGRKRWNIYPPTLPLPLSYQTHDQMGHQCPALPSHELTVEEGDVLYVPRGWWHHAIPLNEASFHLSVGVYPPSVFDYVMWTASRFLEQNPAARRSFSPHDDRAALAATYRELADRLLDAENAAAFDRDAQSRETLESEFALQLFLDPAQRGIPDAAILSLTSFRAPGLDGGELLANGARLTLDADTRAVVAQLRNAGPMRFGELRERLPALSHDALHRAVLSLAGYDLLTIATARPESGNAAAS
jgi:ribosomal protein L16 Arg81 hydroxylase